MPYWREWLHRTPQRLQPYQASVNLWWLGLSMRTKLSLLFTGLILIMTSFFYAFAIFQATREIKISAIYKGSAVAEALRGETLYALQNGNFANLNFTFRRLSSSRNDIVYVYLLDPSGQVLSHSEPEKVGQISNDPLVKLSVASNAMTVQFEQIDLEGAGDLSDICNVSVPIIYRGKRAATLRIGVSLTQYLLANGPRVRRKVLLFALPFAFLSILIAIRLSESLTRPLKRLAQAATEVSQGNFTVQLPLNRRDELGEVAHAFNAMAIHLKENFAKVSEMANRDGLTGLYNSRFFQDALARELERIKRNGRPLSLIIFDADKFKRVNDHYGHPVGDQILQHICRIARSVFRGYDVLARYGGEEFIAMLTDTTSNQAVFLAERLRKMVEQRPYVTDEGDVIKATISVGVAQAQTPYDKKNIISQADQALYRAKETGRNKVVVFKAFSSPPAPSTPATNFLS